VKKSLSAIFAPFAFEDFVDSCRHVRDDAGVIAGTVPADHGEITMDVLQTISKVEQQRRALQRAMNIAQFCQRYGIGRTTAYAEIKQKRLRGRKIGKRTIITEDDAEDWLRRLPVIEGGAR
jgi:hypothetical protein